MLGVFKINNLAKYFGEIYSLQMSYVSSSLKRCGEQILRMQLRSIYKNGKKLKNSPRGIIWLTTDVNCKRKHKVENFSGKNHATDSVGFSSFKRCRVKDLKDV